MLNMIRMIQSFLLCVLGPQGWGSGNTFARILRCVLLGRSLSEGNPCFIRPGGQAEKAGEGVGKPHLMQNRYVKLGLENRYI